MQKSLLTIFPLTIFIISLFLFFEYSNQLLRTSETNFDKMTKVESHNQVFSPIDSYYASSQPKAILASVGTGDSRPIIIDNFLSRHNSPMKGLGNIFVEVADKYNLDYRLLPAIAFQESTLGKNMPRGSHNAFGWAIYTGQNSGARFHNWEYAIETVAAGLKRDYIDQGLTTVSAIMSRYTPDSDGTWAFGVNFAMGEMTQ